jgi:hypothetical protein
MSRFASLFLNDNADQSSRPAATEGEPPEKYRILFVDDETNVLNAMRRIFRQEN